MAGEQIHTTTAQWDRWRAPAADVLHAAEQARDLLAERGTGEPAFYISIQQPGVDSRYYDLGEFKEALSGEEIRRATRIYIAVREGEADDHRIRIDLFRRSGAVLEVNGSNRTWVVGAAERMKGLLAGGSRGPAHETLSKLGVVGAVVVVAILLASVVTPKHYIHDLPWTVRAGIAAGTLFFVALAISPLLGQLLSGAEVVFPGEPSRWRMRWSLARRFAVWVATIGATVAGTIVLGRLLK